jgi:hypothetical protein
MRNLVVGKNIARLRVFLPQVDRRFAVLALRVVAPKSSRHPYNSIEYPPSRSYPEELGFFQYRFPIPTVGDKFATLRDAVVDASDIAGLRFRIT